MMKIFLLSLCTVGTMALPTTYEQYINAANMRVGKRPWQLGIPRDLAVHLAGADRAVDRATAEVPVRRMWLHLNGKVHHPSPAVNAEITRLLKEKEQAGDAEDMKTQDYSSLLEKEYVMDRDGLYQKEKKADAEMTAEERAEETRHAKLDQENEARRDKDLNRKREYDEGEGPNGEYSEGDGFEKWRKKYEEKVGDFVDETLGNFEERINPETGDPMLYIQDTVAGSYKTMQDVLESSRRESISYGAKAMKDAWTEMGNIQG